MLRATASKVMWVGRATVFLVGLSVIVALVLGVASTALGANGKPFILGKAANTASKVTGLIGKVATGSALVVKNPSGGTALELSVGDPAADPASKSVAPMKVDSQELVSNLNSDELDGKSSTDFAAAYKSTVVVSPVGTNAENGTALLDALTGITDASASKPYLIHIEPATYDLGNGSLSMKPFVDIEGSGELNTVITSGVSAGLPCSPLVVGTVNGASNAEMRFLTVRNTGTDVCSSAIFNKNASPRLTHLTAEATGVGHTKSAVVNDNSFPTMTDVTATASTAPGSSFAYAVFDNGSSPTMTDVTATASGATSIKYGVFNQNNSSPTIRQSELSVPPSGSNNALAQIEGGSSKVALSQLVGGVASNSGSVTCAGVYDENLAFFANTCPS
jgi:hypothetical protein